MDRLRDLRQLKRIPEDDQVAGRGPAGERVRQRHLAGLVDDEVIEGAIPVLAGEEPRRARDHPVVAMETRRDVLEVVHPVVALVGAVGRRRGDLARHAQAEPALVGRGEHLAHEVVDGLVALGHEPDALPGGDQLGHHPAAEPGLPGAGRALHHQVALLEVPREAELLLERRRLERGAVR